MTGQLRVAAFGVLATLLASLCLAGVFEGAEWFGPVLFVVLAVAASCQGARMAGVPRVLVPLVGVVGLLLAIVVAFANDHAILGIIPEADTVDRLYELVAQGRRDINRYAAPVAPLTGIVLITAAGVGLVALIVDTVAVTAQRAALAGLPLLALYSVPAAIVPEGVSWIAFAIGAAGFLALLLAEARERVTTWGRPLDGPNRGPIRTEGNPLGALGRRVGAASIGLAIVLPVVMPTLGEGVFGNGTAGFGTGSGTNRVEVNNPILDLKDDLKRPTAVEIMSYTTDDNTPEYLRMTTLDEFTGSVWQPSRLQVQGNRVNEGFGQPPGLIDSGVLRETVRTDIDISNLESRWLPLPYPSRRVDIDDSWRFDRGTYNVFSTRRTTRDKSYAVTSYKVTPTTEQLRDAVPAPDSFNKYRALPTVLDPTVERIAQEAIGDAKTPYDKAVALQHFFRDSANGFKYDESAPEATSASAITDFLRQRRGFCVQFASAMAVLARHEGIPARVDVGFTQGTLIRGRWHVSSNDAHAWPELYFHGIGWVRFEPTPGGAAGTPPPYSELAEETPGAGTNAPTDPSGAGSTETRINPKVLELEAQDFNPNPTLPNVDPLALQSADEGFPWVIAGVLVAAVLAVVPMTTRIVVRRRRWRRATTPTAQAEAAWAELRDTADDYRVELTDSETPRRFAVRLSVSRGFDAPARSALAAVVTASERARYARSVGDVGDLHAEVATVRAALASHASRWARLRARVLPASTLNVVHSMGERVADALDWLDAAMASLRARLVPGRVRQQ